MKKEAVSNPASFFMLSCEFSRLPLTQFTLSDNNPLTEGKT